MSKDAGKSAVRIGYSTDAAPGASGAYSQAVRIGEVVWVAGQAGLDPKTREYVASDIEGQCRQALTNLGAVLESAGLGFNDVIRIGVFLADLEERSRMNPVYKEFFAEPYPARTTVGATLPKGMRIEIDAMAVAVD